MPGLGLGLASGYGAAGAGDALRDLIRQRLEERKFQEQQRDAVARLEEQIAGRKADDALRERDLTGREEDRRQQRQLLDQERGRTEARSLRDDARSNVAAIVGRTIVAPEQVSAFTKADPMLATQFDRAALESRPSVPQAMGGGENDPAVPTGPQGTMVKRMSGAEIAGEASLADRQQGRADMLADRQEGREQAADLRREMAALTQSNRSEVLTQVQDPATGQIVLIPRSQAGGMAPPKTAAERQKIDAYLTTLEMIRDVKALGNEVKWRGVGPVGGTVGSLGMRALGVGNPKEEQLRAGLSRLRAQASFAEGGKQFTGTEQKLIDSFVANMYQNPKAAIVRLDEFTAQARRTLANLGVPESEISKRLGEASPSTPSAGRKWQLVPEGR